MDHHENDRIPGALIALGALLTIAGFVVHPAEGATVDENMAVVAANEGAWRASHGLLAAGTLGIVVGLLATWRKGGAPLFSGGGRLGLAAIILGGTLSTVFFALEATAAPDAAIRGDRASFAAYSGVTLALVLYAFTAYLAGFVALGASEAAAQAPMTRRWAGYVGAATAGLSVVGNVTAYGFGVAGAAVLFYAALPMLLYVAWLGVALARGHAPAPTGERAAQGA